MKLINAFLFGGAWLFFSASGHADEKVEEELLGLYGSEEFISIATGYKQAIEKAPAVATIITADDIKRIGATDIDEALEMVPGLHVAKSYQGYNPIYTFRGIYTDFNPQVLMLIDGVPLSNLFSGNRTNVWSGLPIQSVQRIEVVRGPGSAIYGADAFAGVINIITKNASDVKGMEVGVSYGTYNTKNYFINFGREWNDSSLAIFFEGYNTDGSDERIDADAQTLLDGNPFAPTDASNAPGALNLGRDRIDLRVNYQFRELELRGAFQRSSNGETGAGLVQALDDSGEFGSDRLLLSMNYVLPEMVKDLSGSVSASYMKITQEVEEDVQLYPPGSYGPFFFPGTFTPIFPPFENGVIGNPELFETHSRFDATFRYEGIDSHDLTVGIGYYYGDLYRANEARNYCLSPESCVFIFPKLLTQSLVDHSDTPFVFVQEGGRENIHIYLQDVFNIANDWELTAGVRYDDYSDFGSTVNPRFALVWSTTNKLTTKFLYGEAFRAPAFIETRATNNPQSLGNPDLDPETLSSYEVALSYRYSPNVTYGLNAFYYEWNDIIQFVSDPGASTKTAQNFGKQTGYGMEAEAVWKPSDDFTLRANFALQESTNETLNEDAANSPEKQLYLESEWEFMSRSYINLRANWVVDRNREVGDVRNDIDDYVLVDLGLRRSQLSRGFEVGLYLKNLFDEDAREPSPNALPAPSIPHDLPLPGRTLMGEVRYHF